MFSYLEEISKRGLSLGFLFSEIHSNWKIVDETAVDVENDCLAKTRDEHIAEPLVLVPRAHAFCQCYSKDRVTLKDLGEPMKQRSDFCLTENWGWRFFQWLFVILKKVFIFFKSKSEILKSKPNCLIFWIFGNWIFWSQILIQQPEQASEKIICT